MAGKATKGSHCIRMKRTKAGKRCAVFGRGGGKRRGARRGKRKGGFGSVGGDVSMCLRYKRVTIKKGKRRGKSALRCATFRHGPGVTGPASRRAWGVKRPLSANALLKRERAARLARQSHQRFARRAA